MLRNFSSDQLLITALTEISLKQFTIAHGLERELNETQQNQKSGMDG